MNSITEKLAVDLTAGQRAYNRLSEAMEKGMGFPLPEFERPHVKPILHFLEEYQKESIATGRLLAERRTYDDIVRQSAQAPEANIFVQQLKKICAGIDTKSVHVLATELKHLHNTIKSSVKK